MRRFVRHPSSIPIELSVARVHPPGTPAFRNVSRGGFACTVAEPLPVGSAVQLRIPMIWPEYHGSGVVAWCHKTEPAYEVGIQFSAQQSFSAKMAGQLAQIEQYRLHLQQSEGRTLSNEQAAIEWIALYAKDYSESFFEPDDMPDR
jgi:hypothetical protein